LHLTMKNIMLSTSGEGKELSDYLRRELGIPPGVTNFEVRFARNEPVVVKCEYLAQVKTAKVSP
jgi:hypothetical protein